MYTMIVWFKAIPRWLVFHLGSPEFSPYSDAARATSGYTGWYEVAGRVIAFQHTSGAVQFAW